LGCGRHLPLRRLVDGVDVVDALGFGQVALMHRIEAPAAGPALRVGLAPLADRDRCGPGLAVVEPPLAIGLAVAQVVELAVRDAGQPLELSLAVDIELALEDGPRGRSGERLVGLVDCGQQLRVGACIARLEAVPDIVGHPHLAGCLEAGNPARDLRPTMSGHSLEVAL
jgi:hypothetical protein